MVSKCPLLQPGKANPCEPGTSAGSRGYTCHILLNFDGFQLVRLSDLPSVYINSDSNTKLQSNLLLAFDYLHQKPTNHYF